MKDRTANTRHTIKHRTTNTRHVVDTGMNENKLELIDLLFLIRRVLLKTMKAEFVGVYLQGLGSFLRGGRQ